MKNAEKQQLIIRKYFGEFFTELSKAFIFLSEDLFNVKLNATTVSSFSVLKLDYARNKNVDSSHNAWNKIFACAPHGNILGVNSLQLDIWDSGFGI